MLSFIFPYKMCKKRDVSLLFDGFLVCVLCKGPLAPRAFNPPSWRLFRCSDHWFSHLSALCVCVWIWFSSKIREGSRFNMFLSKWLVFSMSLWPEDSQNKWDFSKELKVSGTCYLYRFCPLCFLGSSLRVLQILEMEQLPFSYLQKGETKAGGY